MFFSRLLACGAILAASAASAHTGETAVTAGPAYTLTPVFSGPMSDPALDGYGLQSVRLDIIPGGSDTSPHRHDADTFVYVLQGEVEIELDGQKATYKAGQMFHEPRNALHSLLRNTDAQQPASVLAIFVIRNDRQSVVPEN